MKIITHINELITFGITDFTGLDFSKPVDLSTCYSASNIEAEDMELTGFSTFCNELKLDQMNFKNSRLIDFRYDYADTHGADFSGAVITKGSFQGCKIWDGKFIGTKFVEVNFSNASFKKCDFTNAEFINCIADWEPKLINCKGRIQTTEAPIRRGLRAIS